MEKSFEHYSLKRLTEKKKCVYNVYYTTLHTEQTEKNECGEEISTPSLEREKMKSDRRGLYLEEYVVVVVSPFKLSLTNVSQCYFH